MSPEQAVDQAIAGRGYGCVPRILVHSSPILSALVILPMPMMSRKPGAPYEGQSAKETLGLMPTRWLQG